MIHFFLMVNKHGQTRLADYFGPKCARPPAHTGTNTHTRRLALPPRSASAVRCLGNDSCVICDRLA